jgi:hypothetical protein
MWLSTETFAGPSLKAYVAVWTKLIFQICVDIIQLGLDFH